VRALCAQLALLQRDAAGALAPVATITAEVEQARDCGSADAARAACISASADATRAQVNGVAMLVVAGAPAARLDSLVDVPVVMSNMAQAIRRAVMTARPRPAV
jgi:hypothetical protein